MSARSSAGLSAASASRSWRRCATSRSRDMVAGSRSAEFGTAHRERPGGSREPRRAPATARQPEDAPRHGGPPSGSPVPGSRRRCRCCGARRCRRPGPADRPSGRRAGPARHRRARAAHRRRPEPPRARTARSARRRFRTSVSDVYRWSRFRVAGNRRADEVVVPQACRADSARRPRLSARARRGPVLSA